MNLKEAFRYQNKLNDVLGKTQMFLNDSSYITTTKKTYLYKKANPEAENETVLIENDFDYSDNINDLIEFSMYLIEQKKKLLLKICECKKNLPIDLDGEVSLNRYRQNLSRVLRGMNETKSSEKVDTNAGVGYRFNNEGNQVSYRCDVETVTTINFDRKLTRKYSMQLSEQADKISVDVDKCLIDSVVDYTPPFDVNCTFEEIFEDYLQNK